MRAGLLLQQKQQTIDAFERFLTRGAEPQWPLEVFLEVSNVCNLSCAMCGPFSALNENRLLALAEQERGFLDLDQLERSLEPVLQHALLVHAFGYGEPTVHPRFLHLLERLSAHEVMIDFITNGQRLSEVLCERLVDLQVAAVTVSASGSTRDDYESIYLGGDFGRLLQGLTAMAAEKAKRHSAFPIVTVNSIGLRHHINTLPEFVDLMADHGVNVIEVKKLMDDVPMMQGHAAAYDPEVERTLHDARVRAAARGVLLSTEQFARESAASVADPIVPLADLRSKAQRFGARVTVPSAPAAQAVPSSLGLAFDMAPLDAEHFGFDGQFHCPEPFKTLYVRRNGLVKGCCFAPDSAPPLGDLKMESSAETWTGLPYRFIRAGIGAGRYSRSACEWCIRRGSGPKAWVARERIRDFADWYAARFGQQLTTASPYEPIDPSAVCASADLRFRPGDSAERARTENDEDLMSASRLRDRLAGNSSLGISGDTTGAPIDVVIPVFNAREHLVRCLEAVAVHTDVPFRLILLNDGSTEGGIAALMESLRGLPGLVVVSRTENVGFVQTANEGLTFSGTNDVVLLNSDTRVSAGWLRSLRRIARSRPGVATVTPLTNNGTLCSVPIPFRSNPLPEGYDLDSFAALVSATSFRLYPEVPTGVGFCLFITRRAIRSVGLFDAHTFGRGYGEENDFCQRAIAAGFVNLIADDVFVFHAGGASFGTDAGALTAEHLEVVRTKHPHYASSVSNLLIEHPLRAFHAYLGACVDAARTAGEVTAALRVLHVLHQGGGTEKHVRELAQTVDRSLSNFVCTSDGGSLTVDEYFGGLRLRRMMLPLPERVAADDPRPSAGYREAFDALCSALDVHLIHVHHLRNNTIDIIDVARERRNPLVLTIHDYHLVCPSYTLLDTAGRYCGACLTSESASERAASCLGRQGRSCQFLEEYQESMERLLASAAAIVAPSDVARTIVAGRYPVAARALVIEHGHRVVSAQSAPGSASTQGRLRAAVLGGLDIHKGRDVFRRLLRANRSTEVVFHLYGTTSDTELAGLEIGRETLVDGSRFVNCGPYDSGEIVGRLRQDAIDLGLHLSIWPETFSFTLSEFAAAGVPVIAGRLGAQGARVEVHELGWTVADIENVEHVVELLSDLAVRRSRLADAQAAMQTQNALRPLTSMWDEYAALYRNTWELRMTGDDRTTPREVSGYVASIAARLADEHDAHQHTRHALDRSQQEVQRLEELLRSPRHRVATAAAGALHRIPVIWPIVSRLTDAILARRRAAAAAPAPPPV